MNRIIFLISLLFIACAVKGQAPGWEVTPSNFANSGEINAIVIRGVDELSNGTLGAFVGSECRGVATGSLFPPTGKTVFSIMCYSNASSGETLSFKYYDPGEGNISDIDETIAFVSDMVVGNAASPQEFRVTEEGNSPPEVDNPLPDLSLVEGFGARNISLAGVFSDPDSDPLTFSVVSSHINVVAASIIAGNLRLLEQGTGNAQITVTASDGNGGTVDDVFTVTVSAGNQPPVVDNPLPDLNLDEGFGSTSVSLTGVFSDPDSDPLAFSVVSSNTGVATAAISGNNISITEQGSGSTQITVTASDGNGGTADDVFTLTVSAVDDGPGWEVAPSDFSNSGEINAIVIRGVDELSNGTLGAFVGSECRGVATGSLFPPTGKTVFSIMCYSNASSGETLSFKYYDPGEGNISDIDETIAFVSDMVVGNAASPQEFRVTEEGNSPPEVDNPLPDLSLVEGFGARNISLSGVFSDPDSDPLSFSVVSSNTGVATAAISGNNISITEQGTGNTQITVTASDGSGGTVDDIFTVTVSEGNQPPVIDNPLPDLSLVEGFGARNISLAGVFSDPDSDPLTFSVVSSNTGVATAAISSNNISITEQGSGSTQITVTASDGNGGTVDDVFTVTVSEGNQPPVIDNPLPDLSLVEGFGARNISLAGVFSDPDSDPLTFSVASSNTGVATAAISGNNISITEQGSGSTQITVTASDGNGGTVDDVFTVTVSEGNQPPVVDNPLPDLNLDEGFSSTSISLTGVFSDPDSDPLAFSVISSNTGVATAAISGNNISITEQSTGNTQITITANDGNGGTVDDVFTLTVSAVDDGPGWEVAPSDFSNSGEVNAIVIRGVEELSNGTLGAFVGSECRGVATGSLFPPTGKTVFSIMCYSNASSGETLSFKYYDPAQNAVFDINETIAFVPDMVEGNAMNPLNLNLFVDNIPPEVTANPSSGIDLENDNSVLLTFSEEVLNAETDINITGTSAKKITKENDLEYSVNFTAADKATVTINIPSTITDLNGNSISPVSFTYQIDDNTSPEIISVTPETASNTKNEFDVTIRFSEPVWNATSGITESGGTGIEFKSGNNGDSIFVVSLSGNDDDEIRLSISDIIIDGAGNPNNLKEEGTYTYIVGDNTAPTVELASSPDPQQNTFDINLSFNEPVKGVSSGLTISNADIDAITGEDGDRVYTVTITGDDESNVILLLKNTIADLAGNSFVSKAFYFTIGDWTKPAAVSFSPTGFTGDDTTFDLVIEFNEDVIKGSGYLTIFNGSNPFSSYDLSKATIVGNELKIPVSLDRYTDYFVNIHAGFVKDNAGNLFEGINDIETWNFSTGNFSTGIKAMENPQFEIYPNPFNQMLFFSNYQMIHKVEILNISGQKVIEKLNVNTSIATDQLMEGIYLVKIRDINGNIYTYRVIKK